MLRDGQDSRKTQRWIAAELGLDEMRGDNTRLVRAVADALQRALASSGCFFGSQWDFVVSHVAGYSVADGASQIGRRSSPIRHHHSSRINKAEGPLQPGEKAPAVFDVMHFAFFPTSQAAET